MTYLLTIYHVAWLQLFNLRARNYKFLSDSYSVTIQTKAIDHFHRDHNAS